MVLHCFQSSIMYWFLKEYHYLFLPGQDLQTLFFHTCKKSWYLFYSYHYKPKTKLPVSIPKIMQDTQKSHRTEIPLLNKNFRWQRRGKRNSNTWRTRLAGTWEAPCPTAKSDLLTNLLTDVCLTGNQTSQLPKAISLTALPILHYIVFQITYLNSSLPYFNLMTVYLVHRGQWEQLISLLSTALSELAKQVATLSDTQQTKEWEQESTGLLLRQGRMEIWPTRNQLLQPNPPSTAIRFLFLVTGSSSFPSSCLTSESLCPSSSSSEYWFRAFTSSRKTASLMRTDPEIISETQWCQPVCGRAMDVPQPHKALINENFPDDFGGPGGVLIL